MVRTNPQVASQSGQMRNAVEVSVVVTLATVRRCGRRGNRLGAESPRADREENGAVTNGVCYVS